MTNKEGADLQQLGPIGEFNDSDTGVGQRAAGGVLWLTVQRWISRLAGFVTIAVLTRFLSPEDFGIVAAASTVLPFFYILADFGFAAYVVQVRRADQRLLSTCFWFSGCAGIALAAALALLAPVFASVYNDERVVQVIQVMSTSVVLMGLGSVPVAILRRSMKFSTLAQQGVASAIVAQVVAIAMTVAGFGVWSLVAQTLVAALLGCVLAWLAAKWRPSMEFDTREFGRMTRFGVQVIGVEFSAMIRSWAEAAIIANSLGLAGLGYWNIAQRLVQVVQDLTGGALVPVSSVAFARIKESLDRLQSAYIRALKYTYALVSLPLLMVTVAAPMVIPILFGDRWSNSSQIAQVLALAGTLTVGASLDHGMFYGLGRPGRWLGYALVVDFVSIMSVWLLVSSGLVAVAIGFLCVALLATIARWFLVARLLGERVATVIRPFTMLLVLAALAGSAGACVAYLVARLPLFLGAAAACVTVLVVYLLVMRLLYREVLNGLGSLAMGFGPVQRVVALFHRQAAGVDGGSR